MLGFAFTPRPSFESPVSKIVELLLDLIDVNKVIVQSFACLAFAHDLKMMDIQSNRPFSAPPQHETNYVIGKNLSEKNYELSDAFVRYMRGIQCNRDYVENTFDESLYDIANDLNVFYRTEPYNARRLDMSDVPTRALDVDGETVLPPVIPTTNDNWSSLGLEVINRIFKKTNKHFKSAFKKTKKKGK